MPTQSKAALVEKMKSARAMLENALAGLTPEQLVMPGVETDWSVSDVMAHLLFWEQRALFLLKAARDGYSASDDRWIGSVDDLNASNFEANKHRPAQDIIDEERAVFNTMLHLVESASDDSLFEAEHFSWIKGDSLATRIANETYEHIDDHIDALTLWHDKNAGH